MMLRFLVVMCLSFLIQCDPVLDEEFDVMEWSGTDLVWTQPFVNNTLFNSTKDVTSSFVNDDIIDPTANMTVSIAEDDIIDLGFRQAEIDFVERLNHFLGDLFGLNNTTDVEGPYTYITAITVIPLRCSDVKKIVDMFDSAVREANPGVDFTSVARRLGKSACNADGICPCLDVRRYMNRVLEIQTVSPVRNLARPSSEKFPYLFEMKSVS